MPNNPSFPLIIPAGMRPPKPMACGGCYLETKGSAFVPPIGQMQSGVAIVGEAPGEKEEIHREPFHQSGQSGMMLSRAIAMVGQNLSAAGMAFNREQLLILNAINCRPPYNSLEGKWSEGPRHQCLHGHVMPALIQARPRAILALGNTALKSLTTFGMGKKAAIASVRGFYLDSPHPALQGIPVIGAYHPAFILRSEKPALIHVLAQDIARALGWAIQGPPSRPTEITRHWIPEGTPEHLRAQIHWLRDNPNAPVGHDIETEDSQVDDESTIRGTEDGRVVKWLARTGEDFDGGEFATPATIEKLAEQIEADEMEARQPEDAAHVIPEGRWASMESKRITRFHIALSKEWAVSYAYTPELWTLYLELLRLPNPKYTWNGRLFDNPILRAYGARIEGIQIDLMNVAHFYLPDWPMGLQSMTSHCWPELGPWKHLSGVDDGYYGCADVAALFAIVDPVKGLLPRFIKTIERFHPGAQERIHHRIREHVVKVGAALDKIQDHGIPVDRDKHKVFKTSLACTLDRLNGRLQYYVTKALPEVPALQEWRRRAELESSYAPATTHGKRLEWAQLTGASSFELDGHTIYLGECDVWEDVPVLGDNGKPIRRKAVGPNGEKLGLRPVTEHKLVHHPGLKALVYKPRKVPKEWTVDDLQLRQVEVQLPDPYDKEAEHRQGLVWRWCLPVEWNPNSHQQLLDYIKSRVEIERAQLQQEGRAESNARWYIPENPQERGKDWTGSKGLERLVGLGPKTWRVAHELDELDNTIQDTRGKTARDKWLAKRTGWARGNGGDLFERDGRVLFKDPDRAREKTRDPILRLTVLYKAHQKLEGFVKSWEPGPDGLVHTSFGFGPATGQLNSKSPNTQQYPKHGALAGQFRNIIVPRRGKVFVSADFSGFHAITTGFEAGSPNYVRLARLDIHSFLTAQGEKYPGAARLLGYNDIELADRLKDVKKKHEVLRDTMYKRALLGLQFGMGPFKLSKLNPEAFPTAPDAKRVFDVIRYHFPEIFEWQDAQRQKAHRQKFILSRYNYLRWFWSVLIWNSAYNHGRGGMAPGPDSEKAIAFEPANDAFGIVRDVLLDFDTDRHPRTGQTYTEFCGLMNNVHDSLEAEPYAKDLEEVIDYMARTMTKPRKVLTHPTIAPDGLWCDVEISVGPGMGVRWDEAAKRHVPLMEKVLNTRSRWLK